MSAFENIVITDTQLIWIILATALLVLLPIPYVIFWKKKTGKKSRFKALLIGAFGFILSARVLELGVHMVCLVLDTPISRFLNSHLVAFVIYGIVMAGVFEEVGRFVILKFLVKKENTKENAVMYGIGHGGIEVWAISLMAMISYLMVAITFRQYGAKEALDLLGINESNFAAALPVVNGAATFGALSAFFIIEERILCMFIHISLTVIVYAGVKAKNAKPLFLAILLHMCIDLLPAISQKVAVTQFLVQGWLLLWTVITVTIAWKAYQSCGE